MMAQAALLTLLSWSVFVVASSAVNQTTGQEVPSLLSVTSAEETRRVRRLEAEMETLRRMVTDLKAAGPCTAQQSLHPKASVDLLEEVHGLHSQLQSLQVQRELSTLRSEIQAVRSAMKSDEKMLTLNDKGSVYERWGHGECPEGAELVYSGVIGGSYYNETGAAANALCLPLYPVLEDFTGVDYYTHILGAEFQVNPLPPHDLDPKCTVCRVPRATVVMVPAAKTCHEGWTLEYTGYIMAGHHTQKAATEFICMDSAMQGRAGSSNNDNGKLFYYVTTSCGSLPCPPYESKKIITCAVCTK